jgi:hypothetical protein
MSQVGVKTKTQDLVIDLPEVQSVNETATFIVEEIKRFALENGENLDEGFTEKIKEDLIIFLVEHGRVGLKELRCTIRDTNRTDERSGIPVLKGKRVKDLIFRIHYKKDENCLL